jgi:hypothetical protein
VSAKDDKNQQFTFKTLVRLLLFSLLLYYLFTYLSQNIVDKQSRNDPTVLGQESEESTIFLKDVYLSLPESSRQKLENLDQFPPYLYLEKQSNYLLNQINGFPQKQLNQLKKDIIQSVYQDLMKNLNEN